MWSSTFFYKSRNRTLTRLLAGEERLQLSGDDAPKAGPHTPPYATLNEDATPLKMTIRPLK